MSFYFPLPMSSPTSQLNKGYEPLPLVCIVLFWSLSADFCSVSGCVSQWNQSAIISGSTVDYLSVWESVARLGYPMRCLLKGLILAVNSGSHLYQSFNQERYFKKMFNPIFNTQQTVCWYKWYYVIQYLVLKIYWYTMKILYTAQPWQWVDGKATGKQTIHSHAPNRNRFICFMIKVFIKRVNWPLPGTVTVLHSSM